MIGGCSSVSCPTLPIYSLILFFTTKIDEHPKKNLSIKNLTLAS
jgi:hypothetical protein